MTDLVEDNTAVGVKDTTSPKGSSAERMDTSAPGTGKSS